MGYQTNRGWWDSGICQEHWSPGNDSGLFWVHKQHRWQEAPLYLHHQVASHMAEQHARVDEDVPQDQGVDAQGQVADVNKVDAQGSCQAQLPKRSGLIPWRWLWYQRQVAQDTLYHTMGGGQVLSWVQEGCEMWASNALRVRQEESPLLPAAQSKACAHGGLQGPPPCHLLLQGWPACICASLSKPYILFMNCPCKCNTLRQASQEVADPREA